MSDKPEWAVGNVMFDLSPNMRVNVWISGDANADAASLRSVTEAVNMWVQGSSDRLKAVLLSPSRPAAPSRQPSPSSVGKFSDQSRAGKYPKIDGYKCDVCDGPCGVYPRTGNMRAAKVVCLGRCKDDQYVHTVAWLEADAPAQEDVGISDDDDAPF